MTRIAPLFLLFLFVHPSAQAKSTHNSWATVEQLPVGQLIEVLERNGNPTFCRIDRTDDATLACITNPRYNPPQRLVFPVENIAAIYSEEWVHQWGLLRGIDVFEGVVFGVIGGMFCAAPVGLLAGPTAAIVAGSVGAVIFGWYMLHDLPPTPPHIRRRLIYKVPDSSSSAHQVMPSSPPQSFAAPQSNSQPATETELPASSAAVL